ncbi:MAG: YaiI/YqxD family protein [Maricaulis sp.]|nr:YaiI/YqxD family protein [Maricaulis sp.]MDG2045054.1 YaiI/YqxD family protein [Maricaulis sp.]
MTIYVDADACPVKDEVIRVGERHQVEMLFVCDGGIRRPNSQWAKLVIVDQGADAADDWIAENIGKGDVCVTADIPLADRCLKAGGLAIDPRGKAFTAENMGSTLATRDLMTDLRSAGMQTGGARPFDQKDRSAFLNGLEMVMQAAKRAVR